MHTGMHTHTKAHIHTHTQIYTQVHAHTQAPTNTSILTKQNLIYPQFKTGSQQRLEMDENNSTEWKTWQVYSFGEKMS